MDKLKTLKDIKSEGEEHNKDCCKKCLQEEAIKWIKEFQRERTEAITEMFDNPDKHGIYPTTKFFNRIDKFWKNKFNLTEEDLMDKSNGIKTEKGSWE